MRYTEEETLKIKVYDLEKENAMLMDKFHKLVDKYGLLTDRYCDKIDQIIAFKLQEERK